MVCKILYFEAQCALRLRSPLISAIDEGIEICITLNFLLFANYHFSKTARNLSDSKKCGLYLIDNI